MWVYTFVLHDAAHELREATSSTLVKRENRGAVLVGHSCSNEIPTETCNALSYCKCAVN